MVLLSWQEVVVVCVCAEAKPERLCVLSSLSVLMASAASLELFGTVSGKSGLPDRLGFTQHGRRSRHESL